MAENRRIIWQEEDKEETAILYAAISFIFIVPWNHSIVNDIFYFIMQTMVGSSSVAIWWTYWCELLEE